MGTAHVLKSFLCTRCIETGGLSGHSLKALVRDWMWEAGSHLCCPQAIEADVCSHLGGRILRNPLLICVEVFNNRCHNKLSFEDSSETILGRLATVMSINTGTEHPLPSIALQPHSIGDLNSCWWVKHGATHCHHGVLRCRSRSCVDLLFPGRKSGGFGST